MNGSDTAWVANIRIERPGAANDLVLGPGASCPTPGLGCTENFTGWNAEMLPASAALGGGSIGLNRYRVYGTDSVVAVQNRTPVTENVVNGTFSIRRGRDCQTTTVTMRYYGPLLPLGGPRIQVYEQFCGGSGGFISPSSLLNPVFRVGRRRSRSRRTSSPWTRPTRSRRPPAARPFGATSARRSSPM